MVERFVAWSSVALGPWTSALGKDHFSPVYQRVYHRKVFDICLKPDNVLILHVIGLPLAQWLGTKHVLAAPLLVLGPFNIPIYEVWLVYFGIENAKMRLSYRHLAIKLAI